MAWSVAASATGYSVDGKNVTSAAINSTGATAFLVFVSTVEVAGPFTVSDSKGNTWTNYGQAIALPSNPRVIVTVYGCLAPTSVGAGHTVSLTSSKNFYNPSMSVFALTGVTAPLFDVIVTAGTDTVGTSASGGSLSPTDNNDICFAVMGCVNNNSDAIALATVDHGYSIVNRVGARTVNTGLVSSYQVLSGKPTQTPTWTVANASYLAMVQVALSEVAVGTGTLIVTKVTAPTGSPQPFTFTAGGGLSPTTVTLTDGQSYTFNNVLAGSGYSILESEVSGWSVVYAVSNGSPIDNLTIADAGTTIVTATNTYTTPVVTTRNIRWMRQGPHMVNGLDRVFHQQFRLNMEVGVGNGDAPAPTITLQWSDDGGYTWSDGVSMPMGAAGAYNTLVQWFRLGKARDRVYRVWSDDPVLGQLIDGYAVVEPGIGGA